MGNRGKGNKAQGTIISSTEAHTAVLLVGRCFTFGKGSTTTEVRRITALTSKQFSTRPPNPEAIKNIVWQLIKPYAEVAGVPGIAPHDMRRYAESRTMPNLRCASLCNRQAAVNDSA